MTSSAIKAPQHTLLYQHERLSLILSDKADQQAIPLLQQTTYGTRGVRYRQTGQEKKINRLNNPFFFHLYNHTELIGFYCLDQRPVNFPNAKVGAYYGRYLVVREDVQGKGYGQLLKTTATTYVAQHEAKPYLLYSYIEAKNSRSLAASYNENFQSVAQLKTFLFRRFSPKKDKRFQLISNPDKLMSFVKTQYSYYGFQHFKVTHDQGLYFTLEEDGQLLACIRANPICWQFIELQGRLGPLLKQLAPLLPGIRRFFNPAKQEFVVIDGVFLQSGHENLLPVLLESVLAYFGLHTIMWQIDQKDPMIDWLTGPQMGVFSQFQAEVTTHVMVKTEGLPTTIVPGREPVYVSSFDYS